VGERATPEVGSSRAVGGAARRVDPWMGNLGEELVEKKKKKRDGWVRWLV
jgi:hypothetical protein